MFYLSNNQKSVAKIANAAQNAKCFIFIYSVLGDKDIFRRPWGNKNGCADGCRHTLMFRHGCHHGAVGGGLPLFACLL
jgi:hypothetical protein